MTKPGIDLFLLGAKGEAVLRHVLEMHGPQPISAVIAARDAGVDDDCFDEIRQLAETAGVPFSSRGKADGVGRAAIAVGWRWLIKKDYAPLVVLHDALLPRYRGFNPLVSCLLNQEPEIGVTALIASAEYDRGPILAQCSVPITHPLKIAEAIARILPLYAQIAAEIVSGLHNGTIAAGTPQVEADATYSLWRDEEDYLIDWHGHAKTIHRLIWAVGSPYAGAKCLINGRTARITDAEVVDDVRIENRAPGKVIFLSEGIPTVVCGQGLLRILQAIYDDDRTSVLPLGQFRSRFT
jgi:methionyl-tRNA formyltransferase